MQLSNKTITLDVEKDETISAVKSKLRAKEGYPALPQQNIKILYNGKQLDEDRTISDYLIEKDSVLHVRLSLRSEQSIGRPSSERAAPLGMKRPRSFDPCNSLFMADGSCLCQ